MYWLTDNKKIKKGGDIDFSNTFSKLKLKAVQRTLIAESKAHILLLGNIWGWYNLITKIEPGKYNKKESYRLLTINAQTLNKMLADHIQQFIERIIHCFQVGFIPEIERRNLLTDSYKILY